MVLRQLPLLFSEISAGPGGWIAQQIPFPLSLDPLPRWTHRSLSPRLVHSQWPSNSCDVTKGRLAKAKPCLLGYAIGWDWMQSLCSSHKLCCDWPFSVIFPKAWIASESNNSYWQIGWVGERRGFELNASFLFASTSVCVKAYDEQSTIMII